MTCWLEVALKPSFADPAGNSLQNRIVSELGIVGVRSVRVVDIYAIDTSLGEAELRKIGLELLSDQITQNFSVNKPSSAKFDWCIRVSFRAGVKDDVGEAARGAIEEMLGKKLAGGVYSSKLYHISGAISQPDAERIACDLLANPLIQEFRVFSKISNSAIEPAIPRMRLAAGIRVGEVSLEEEGALLDISKQRLLALTQTEMEAVRAHFLKPEVASKRKKIGLPKWPTDAELEAIAQTWSEHCKHKIFNARIKYSEGGKAKVIDSLFKTYIVAATEKASKGKNWIVSVFSDNAGIVKFDSNWNFAFKVETHNSPSALDPYGGALTGILGVNRDVLGAGLGAKPIFNTDVFCFAPPDYPGEIPPKLFHPKRVFEGVRSGVERGGNASGIPTVNGSIVCDKRYLGKPLVYCGTGGLMPAKIKGRETHRKAARIGDRIFMVGGRVGADGIHGATFSSESLNEDSPTSAVQLGDPYTQKKVTDFLLEARDRLLYNAVTDDGAGGLSSSVGEMARESGGCDMDLALAPLKYPGLQPWEILVSESQERMTFAVPKENAKEFCDLAKIHSVEATDLGEFTNSGHFIVKYKGKPVTYLEMEFFHSGVPKMELEAEWKEPALSEPAVKPKSGLGEILLQILSRWNVCSKEYVVRQYDHEVQGASVVKPLTGAKNDGPSDAAVIAPVFGSNEGLVISNGICPKYSDIDAYWMAANALDEAVRNIVATGGDVGELSALDNFCWTDPIYSKENPRGKHKLAQLVRANQALYDGCVAYGVPLISGKDSMKNDYRHGGVGISVPPTLLVSAVAKIKDIGKAVTMDFKRAGESVYALGITTDECGGSEYYAQAGEIGANVPKVDFERNRKLYSALNRAMERGIVSSCHDCSDGGLGVALAESAFAGEVGCRVDLEKVLCDGRLADEKLLFSESAGRFVASVKKGSEAEFEKIFSGCACAKIGETDAGGELVIVRNGQELVRRKLSELKEAWQKSMRW
jgi:phosphoribosylformylglycinamidine synthase